MVSLQGSLAVVAGRVTATNTALAQAFEQAGVDAAVLTAEEACERLGPGDVALGRLDVLAELDGVEPGLWALGRLEGRGVAVLNRAGSLLATHDKLATALRLAACDLPHPRTAHVDESTALPDLEGALVVKPRFGSWGQDVVLCRNQRTLRRCLRRLRHRAWFRRQGALVQELVEPQGSDLRIVVAGGEAVGAVERVAAAGEWRTNVALGGRRRAVVPAQTACDLAIEAARAVGADLVGVDLLPDGRGGHVVLELNGAVDFTQEYALDGADVFARAARALTSSGYAQGDEEEAEEAALLAAGARP